MVLDFLPQEHIWKSWLANPSVPPSPSDSSSSSPSPAPASPSTSSATAELFIHAKHPHKIQFPLVSYKLEWNDVRVVRAMLHLAHLALDDDATAAATHVLICTESCVPIATLDEISSLLLGDVTMMATATTKTKPTHHRTNNKNNILILILILILLRGVSYRATTDETYAVLDSTNANAGINCSGSYPTMPFTKLCRA